MAVETLEFVDEKVLHNFAKRLANNQPRLRKIALKKLKTWMESRSGNMDIHGWGNVRTRRPANRPTGILRTTRKDQFRKISTLYLLVTLLLL